MEKSNNTSEQYFTGKELKTLEEAELIGIKPVAPSLVASLFNLFLEGYSCSEISKQGKGLSEGDILSLRKKFQWDEKRQQYAVDLQNQVQGKLMKAKLEAIEFLTNQMAAIHKSSRDQTLKYLMSGNPDDMPKELGKLGGYKNLIEVLQKLTGEDNTKRIKFEGKMQQDTTIKTDGSSVSITLTEPVQTKLLEALVGQSEPKKEKK